MCNSLGIWFLLDCVSWAYSSFQGVCNSTSNSRLVSLFFDTYDRHLIFCILSVPQVFTFSQKMTVNFQLLLRFIQGLSFLLTLAGLAVAVAITDLSLPDVFACILAFIPTGWGILSVSSRVQLSRLCYYPIYLGWFAINICVCMCVCDWKMKYWRPFVSHVPSEDYYSF